MFIRDIFYDLYKLNFRKDSDNNVQKCSTTPTCPMFKTNV